MKGMKVAEIAKIYGLDPETVRNLCYARGQRFARKIVPRGRWYIDSDLFEEHWNRLQEKTREGKL